MSDSGARRADSAQLVRQWAILRLLAESGRAYSVKELADQLGTSKHRLVDDGDELAGQLDADGRAFLVGHRAEGAADERADVEGDAVGRLGGAERVGPRLELDLAKARCQRLGDEHLVQPARPARHAVPSYGTAGLLRPRAGGVRTGM